MKLKVLKYNKEKAIGKFILFKFLELFALFIFTFGFESLGRFTYERFDIFNLIPTTYIGFWFYGLLSLLLILLISAAVIGLILLVIYLLGSWVEMNWRWAKIASEDEDSKVERLSEQKKLKEIKKIEDQEEERKEYGCCAGDIAVRTRKGDFGKVGDKFKVTNVYDDEDYGEVLFNCKERENGVELGRFKFLKQKSVKPKLNKVREKEVNDRKSKE